MNKRTKMCLKLYACSRSKIFVITSLQKVSLDVKQDQNNQVINTLNKKIGELGAQQQALIQSNIIIEKNLIFIITKYLYKY